MAEQTSTAIAEAASQRAGKYLTFVLAEENYGIEILKVREIMGLIDITSVPRTPDYVKGVINLRGKVIPVIDLRLKFGMSENEASEETCIIVVKVGTVEIGTIVDRVSEVLDIAGTDIEDPPSLGADVDIRFILGMGKAQSQVTILLDIERVLSESELADVASTSLVEDQPQEK